MSYFTAAELANVQANPQSYVAIVYGNNRSRFMQSLGPLLSFLSEDHVKLMFCGLLAFDLKPYGDSAASCLAEILAEPALNCFNYTLLTHYLFDILDPAPVAPNFQIVHVGWNGGAVGNHSQIFVESEPNPGGANAVVDPTYGLMIGGIGSDWVVAGKPIGAGFIADFRGYKSQPASVAAAAATTLNALQTGAYRFRHSAYYYRTAALMAAQATLDSPQAKILRAS